MKNDKQALRRRSLVPLLVFAAASLCAISPLMFHGCSCGHDFDFHLLSWMEAAEQFQHGILKPVWAFTPAFNAGEPRLLLYPPLSWVTGAALGLVLPWAAVPVAFTGLVLFLAGVTMHRLLIRWVPPTLAVLCGCLYMVNPYMLFVAYTRTAYAELMAAAWMPLLLAAMLLPRLRSWKIGIVVALLWATNAPAAVAGCYSILLFGVGRLILMHRDNIRTQLRLVGTICGGVALGFSLDAFYLVPLAWQRRFVQLTMALAPMARPQANFLFAVDKDAYHTHVTTQASWIAVSVCSAAFLFGSAFLFRTRRGASPLFQPVADGPQSRAGLSLRRVAGLLLGFAVVILFLLLPWSAPIWRFGPELQFMQFPWRFLAVLSAVTVALLALLLRQMSMALRPAIVLPVGMLIALLAGYFGGGTYFREACADDETLAALRTEFQERYGVGPTDEYTPADAENDDLPVHLPPAWTAMQMGDDPGAQTGLESVTGNRPYDIRFTVPPSQDTRMAIIRLRRFPGWHVLRDGVELVPEARHDGLLVVPLPSGSKHVIQVSYRTTADQWAGLLVSLATLTLLSITALRERSSMMGQAA